MPHPNWESFNLDHLKKKWCSRYRKSDKKGRKKNWEWDWGILVKSNGLRGGGGKEWEKGQSCGLISGAPTSGGLPKSPLFLAPPPSQSLFFPNLTQLIQGVVIVIIYMYIYIYCICIYLYVFSSAVVFPLFVCCCCGLSDVGLASCRFFMLSPQRRSEKKTKNQKRNETDRSQQKLKNQRQNTNRRWGKKNAEKI